LDAVNLAELLCGRIQAVLPTGLHVKAANGDLMAFSDGFRGPSGLGSAGSYLRQFFDDLAYQYPDEAHLLAATCRHALSDIQDYVAEMTGDPWPVVGPGTMPTPGARVTDQLIHLWYGDEEQPVLCLVPIPLQSI
jgi:hypothetical protein